MESSSAWARGTTGDIRRGSGIVAIMAARGGDIATMPTRGSRAGVTTVAMHEATHARIMAVATRVGTTADSVADSLSVAGSPSAEVSPAVVVASMVEADRTAVDVAERQFCWSEGEWLVAACRRPFFLVSAAPGPVPAARILARMSGRSTAAVVK